MNLTTLFTIAVTRKIKKGAIKDITINSPFWLFVFANRGNKAYAGIALTGVLLQFIVFKLLYPYPDFISDSYSYIATNLYGMKVNLWPIGYSKFLLFIHIISNSDTFLVAIQYLILELSLAYFFYTILYIFRPGKSAQLFLFLFLFFNPIFIYLSNCVLSDAIFTALTVIYISLFLHILYRPSIRFVIIQGVIIGLAFTIRYTAIYYPLISIAGLLLSNHRSLVKVGGSILGIALMIPFYIYTAQATKAVTGTAQFSVFGGWQLANNALYMYDHINVDRDKLPAGAAELDQMAKEFYKKVPPAYRDFEPFPGTYFIKVPFAVLKPYMKKRAVIDDPPSQFAAWGKVSPLYEQYGNWLIRNHPIAFARYYLWLNTKNYFFPHLEKFGSYNVGRDSVSYEAQDWFNYTTPGIKVVSRRLQGDLFRPYPFFFALLNILYLILLGWSILSGVIKRLPPSFRKIFILTNIFLLVNFSFSVFATPVVLRYQVVPMMLLFAFICIFWEYLGAKSLTYIKNQS